MTDAETCGLDKPTEFTQSEPQTEKTDKEASQRPMRQEKGHVCTTASQNEGQGD